MSSAQPRRRSSGKVRALLSLGMLLGITQVGTLAAWSDSATVSAGSFETGTLDLTVGEKSADQLAGQGGSWQHADLSLSDMAPGESVARMLTVGNGGSIALSYNGTVRTGQSLAGADGLVVSVVEDATAATNTGTQAAANRQGSCTGGSATSVAGDAIGTDPRTIHSTAVDLAPDASKTYCVIVKLSADAPNAMQSKSSTVTVDFNAEQ
ncbi:SipW-dependent-type signal peptide-containing protein [Microlunatus soli]|uniref:SipW-cognate class signal peptide n=1 Tax=Microlunatus soli TaxID=630515 RepID=A0A1H1R023_9ACTN|nr:SipW-dependent-type signal peptide-containing protein [Microlunatus soli]SDS29087.1 SipW-cognate class signal peptide [Microlunatus soli]